MIGMRSADERCIEVANEAVTYAAVSTVDGR
jgi:hypothetical protein